MPGQGSSWDPNAFAFSVLNHGGKLRPKTLGAPADTAAAGASAPGAPLLWGRDGVALTSQGLRQGVDWPRCWLSGRPWPRRSPPAVARAAGCHLHSASHFIRSPRPASWSGARQGGAGPLRPWGAGRGAPGLRFWEGRGVCGLEEEPWTWKMGALKRRGRVTGRKTQLKGLGAGGRHAYLDSVQKPPGDTGGKFPVESPARPAPGASPSLGKAPPHGMGRARRSVRRCGP